MNQEIERAIIDQTNKVWETALKVGIAQERERIMELFDEWCVCNVDLNKSNYVRVYIPLMMDQFRELVERD
jgi:hypothetical protein